MNTILQKISAFSQSERDALLEFKADGGKVAALYNRNFPSSLLRGLGIWPVRILTGATGEAVDASEKLIRPDVCPFCRSIIGNFLNKTSMHRQCDVVVGAITCDMMRRTLERLAADIDIPVFPVQVPATTTDESLDYYAKSVQKVIENISSSYKNRIDFDRVRSAEKNRVASAALLADLLWKNEIPPLIKHRLCHLFAWTRPERFLSFLQELMPHMPEFDPACSLILTGSVILLEDDSIIRFLTDHTIGMIPLYSSGLHMVEGLADISGIPDTEIIAALSRITYSMPGNIRKRPNTPVYDWLQAALDKTEARGVIVKSLSFCDLWYTEKERLRQSLPVPVLILDTGYDEGTAERVITRLETFLETVK